jgi:hypothetical protein
MGVLPVPAVSRRRWLTFGEWERSGRSSPAALTLVIVEFLVMAAILIGFRHEWWAALIVPIGIAADYVGQSLRAHRRFGPATWPRMPFRFVSLLEWRERAKERRGLVGLSAVCPAMLAGTGLGLVAVIAMVLLYPADYLWCCASSGAWLASRPDPPERSAFQALPPPPPPPAMPGGALER